MDYSKMTLKEKVLQTFIVTIREINKHGGPEVFFQKYPVGGMYYANGDILLDSVDMKQRAKEEEIETGLHLSREKLLKCRECSKLPLLICSDNLQLENQVESTMGSGSILASQKDEDSYDYGKIWGMQMNEHEVDWLLGPCVDMTTVRPKPLGTNAENKEVLVQAFGKMVDGIHDQGVIATLKHFPGAGAGYVNAHYAPTENILSYEDWMNSYGYVYKELFKKGAMCVMTTHMTLRSYDDENHDGFLPIATYSEKITTDLLKKELGFQGAVVTDALVMAGMATGDLIKETAQAFKAGADLLLWTPVEAADEIVRQLESGEIPMERLDDALTRIEKLRKFREKALADKSFDKPDADFADTTLRRIKKNGIQLLRNDMDLLPIKENVEKILIVDVSNGDDSAELLKEELIRRGKKAEIRTDVYDVEANVTWQDDVDEIQAQYDMIIFNVTAPYEASYLHCAPFMRIWASHLFSKEKKVIINYGSKFMASDFFPEDPTFIQVNTTPNKSTIKSIVEGLLGDFEFTGKTF